MEKPIKILAIDDQSDNLVVLKAVLAEILPQAMLITAQSGPGGIQKARAISPDVVLLDIIMPGMDGFEVCRAIKQEPELRQVPILFLTAMQTNGHLRMQALQAGAEGFLNKPINETELYAQIMTMVKIRQANARLANQNDQLAILVRERTLELELEIRNRIRVEDDLIANRDLMRHIIEHNNSAVAVHDRDLNYIYVSQQYLREYEIEGADIIGRHHYDVFPDLPQKWRDVHRRCLQGEVIHAEEDSFLRPDGRIEWTNWQCRPWLDRNGAIGGIVVYTQLVTHKKQAEMALRESEERFKSIFEQAPMGITLTDSITGQIYQANAKFMEIIGRSFDPTHEYIDWMSYSHPEDIDEDLQNVDRLVAGHTSSVSMDKRFIRPDGTPIWVSIRLTPYQDKARPNPCHLCMVEDITERKAREEEILYLSRHDVLTGLYNRATFDEALQRLDVAASYPLSLIIGDINGLKLVNDAFGHADGDHALIQIARILKANCREQDILARIGGDEFGILLPRTDSEETLLIMLRISEACTQYSQNATRSTDFLSIALGFETKTTAEKPMREIRKEAEDYMYRRKLLEQRSLHNSILSSIRATMEEKSHETREHCERLAEMAKMIGVCMDLSDAQIQDLELLSNLHDIGKIVIDRSILNKAGRLSGPEWVEMKRHPEVGFRIAQASPDIRHIAKEILSHHERWDGHGYPQGLQGEEIPLLARILTIVDAYDAMTHDRSYHQAIPSGQALAEIRASAGSQFDPAIAALFIALMRRG